MAVVGTAALYGAVAGAGAGAIKGYQENGWKGVAKGTLEGAAVGGVTGAIGGGISSMFSPATEVAGAGGGTGGVGGTGTSATTELSQAQLADVSTGNMTQAQIADVNTGTVAGNPTGTSTNSSFIDQAGKALDFANKAYTTTAQQKEADLARKDAKLSNATELSIARLRATRERNQSISDTLLQQDMALAQGVGQGDGSSGTAGVTGSIGAQLGSTIAANKNDFAAASGKAHFAQSMENHSARASRLQTYSNALSTGIQQGIDIFSSKPQKG